MDWNVKLIKNTMLKFSDLRGTQSWADYGQGSIQFILQRTGAKQQNNWRKTCFTPSYSISYNTLESPFTKYMRLQNRFSVGILFNSNLPYALLLTTGRGNLILNSAETNVTCQYANTFIFLLTHYVSKVFYFPEYFHNNFHNNSAAFCWKSSNVIHTG